MNPHESEDQRGCVDQFRWSLQALASDAETQRSLFPAFAPVAEELAMDCAHWSEVARGNFGGRLSAEQSEAIEIIGRRLDAMSRLGPEFSECLWSDDAVRTDPRWEELRALARVALARFGWPADRPPSGRALYAPGRSRTASGRPEA